jgi:hypothetical protein
MILDNSKLQMTYPTFPVVPMPEYLEMIECDGKNIKCTHNQLKKL